MIAKINKIIQSSMAAKKIDKKMVRMAIIAGASHAAEFLKKNRFADADDAVKHVSENIDLILEKIDDPL